MAAVQSSLLTLDVPSRRPPLADNHRSQSERSLERKDSDKRTESKDDSTSSVKDDEVASLTPFLKIFASELLPEVSADASGNQQPLTDEQLPLTKQLASEDEPDVSELTLDVEAEKEIGSLEGEDSAPDKLPESDLIDEEVSVASINPTLASAIASQTKQSEMSLQNKAAEQNKPAVLTPVINSETLSDEVSEFFNPQDMKVAETKPGSLSLLASRAESASASINLDDGLTALRTLNQSATQAAPQSTSNQAIQGTTPTDASAMLNGGKGDAMLLALNGKAQDFPAKFTQQVAFVVGRGLQQAIIRLDPPELGRLEVKVQKEDERVQVQVVTQTPQARELVERNINQLKELFEEQGMQLTDADVQQDDSSDQGSEHSPQEASAEASDDMNNKSEQTQVVSQQLLDTYA